MNESELENITSEITKLTEKRSVLGANHAYIFEDYKNGKAVVEDVTKNTQRMNDVDSSIQTLTARKTELENLNKESSKSAGEKYVSARYKRPDDKK